MNANQLKNAVKTYWNKASCGTETIQEKKFSSRYFQEIENLRYTIEPEIFSFAQFTRARGKKLLEVGVGAGTDFMQWIRAGTHAHGIDLTQEAIDHVNHRLELENLSAHVQVADAQHLPFHDNNFDLVYSWGVIHHSPDMTACLREIIRVTKPEGTIKLMVYHRYSLFALYRWILAALCKGRPFQSLKTVLFFHQESLGTKAYTHGEMHHLLKQFPVRIISLQSPATNHDLLYYKSWPFRLLAYSAACLLGFKRCGWFMMIELQKV